MPRSSVTLTLADAKRMLDAGEAKAASFGVAYNIAVVDADELYVDAAAVDAHRITPHYQDYLARIPTLADRTAIVLEAVTVR
jgi:hypothetical protein